ncbi:MAG: Fe(3+) ABC transporter substrate-binding protein [Alcaligenaceae bacterium]|nr:Fe(3+) ABC transporter substrate-binding protein [Alcaligenaceae bacterium]
MKHKQALLGGFFAISTLTGISSAFAAEEVNLYTTREPRLIQPLLDAFTQDTGIKANTVFIKDGLPERIKSEGDKSPADVLMTVDIGKLLDVVDQDLTQPVQSQALLDIIPANLRAPDNKWFAFSLRDRVLYVANDLDLKEITYEELADPKWKNKICIRSGQHPYNTSLIAAMIAHDGPEKTEAWLKGVKNNLARKAAGGDREVARDILGGICDIGIGNAYYVGRMKNAKPDNEQYKWGEAIKVIRPTFASVKDGGTHVNITGAALAKHSPNKENAIKLLEFLVSEKAQSMYSKTNYEYPIRKGVELDPVVASFGELKVDSLPVTEIAKYRKQASELVDKVGFDN